MADNERNREAHLHRVELLEREPRAGKVLELLDPVVHRDAAYPEDLRDVVL